MRTEPSPRPSWVAYAALATAFHALANTESGGWSATFMAFSFFWSIPAFVLLWRSLRNG